MDCAIQKDQSAILSSRGCLQPLCGRSGCRCGCVRPRSTLIDDALTLPPASLPMVAVVCESAGGILRTAEIRGTKEQ